MLMAVIKVPSTLCKEIFTCKFCLRTESETVTEIPIKPEVGQTMTCRLHAALKILLF